MHRASQPDAERKTLQTTSRASGAPKAGRCQCKGTLETERGPAGSSVTRRARCCVGFRGGTRCIYICGPTR
eukprot:5061148-Pyramimonas_sp.AAC.1